MVRPLSQLVAACVQLTSKADVSANLATVRKLVGQAADRGATLVLLPENFAHMGTDEDTKKSLAEPIGQGGPIQDALAELARTHKVWILGGGMPELGPDRDHVHNTLVAFDDTGRLVGSYRKIHLFDVDIPGGAQHKESASVAPGSEAQVLDTPWGKIGLSVCYDLRFPEMYRALVAKGARILVVPAAFTQHTGKDHWHVLLRARAIENQTWVLAASQYGRHNEKRVTYGHSLIVDPWGNVVADASDQEGLAIAAIDSDFQDKVRREMPCLAHRRL